MYVSVPKFFWPAFVCLTLALALDVPLTGNGFLALTAVLMLIGGLPHGAFDIAIAQSVLKLQPSAAAAFFLAYVGVAAAMMVLWAVAPVTTLCLFLALSAVHFGEDWRMLDSGLLRAMAGASVLCIPALRIRPLSQHCSLRWPGLRQIGSAASSLRLRPSPYWSLQSGC